MGQGVGEVGAFICTACGRFEPYLNDVVEIEWVRVRDLDLHNPQGHQCVKCSSGRIARLNNFHANEPHFRFATARGTGLLAAFRQSQVGKAAALICTDCGYFETYLHDPEAIPWDRIVGFTPVPGRPCGKCGSPAMGRLDRVGVEHAHLALAKGRFLHEGVGELSADVCMTCCRRGLEPA